MELLIEESISVIVVGLVFLNIHFFIEINTLKKESVEDGKYIVRLEDKILKIESKVFPKYYAGGVKKAIDDYPSVEGDQ